MNFDNYLKNTKLRHQVKYLVNSWVDVGYKVNVSNNFTLFNLSYKIIKRK